MSKQRSSGPHRRILVRLCALALIAAMLLTSAYAGGAVESGSAVESLATENLAAENLTAESLAPQSAAPEEGAEADEPEANALAAPAPRAAAHALAGGAVDPDPDPGADLGEPAHRKYIQKNSDGTYTLSLNVTGGTTEWTDQTAEPIDIILLADTSGSMEGNRLRSLKTAANSLAGSILTDENAALPANQQIQLALARFSGYYRDETPSCLTNPKFTANYQTFSTAVNRLGANGATEENSS